MFCNLVWRMRFLAMPANVEGFLIIWEIIVSDCVEKRTFSGFIVRTRKSFGKRMELVGFGIDFKKL